MPSRFAGLPIRLVYREDIAETTLNSESLEWPSPGYDTDAQNWAGMNGYGDQTKDQVEMSVHLNAAGIYRYYP
jgi:hypothetical protein